MAADEEMRDVIEEVEEVEREGLAPDDDFAEADASAGSRTTRRSRRSSSMTMMTWRCVASDCGCCDFGFPFSTWNGTGFGVFARHAGPAGRRGVVLVSFV